MACYGRGSITPPSSVHSARHARGNLKLLTQCCLHTISGMYPPDGSNSLADSRIHGVLLHCYDSASAILLRAYILMRIRRRMEWNGVCVCVCTHATLCDTGVHVMAVRTVCIFVVNYWGIVSFCGLSCTLWYSLLFVHGWSGRTCAWCVLIYEGL